MFIKLEKEFQLMELLYNIYLRCLARTWYD